MTANNYHCILFELSSLNDSKLQPHKSTDAWDSCHVRMPNSKNSKYLEIDEKTGNKIYRSRWELIEKSLLVDFDSSHAFEEAIKKYNTRYENIWDFKTFHKFVEDLDNEEQKYLLKKIIPDIICLALRLPQIIQCPIPLLKQRSGKSISMSQEQASCILANAFLCTFPRRNTDKKDSEFASYPQINFHRLFGSDGGQKNIEKIKCIINYFRRVCKRMPQGVLTFQRNCEYDFPTWKSDTRTFTNIKYHVSSNERIEDAQGMLQVDFANRFIGGGVLGNGCVQEEIRFVINPELIVSKLFVESLEENESFVIYGTEQFNSYTGYANNFQWNGNFKDETPRDKYQRRKCKIVAIDALFYKNTYEQFREENLMRELNKAYSGFHNSDDNDHQPVASGLWGSGVFQGNPIKTALIQLMVCRVTKRNLAFLTFGDDQIKLEVANIFKFLVDEGATVGKLFEVLKNFRFAYSSKDENLIQFVKREVSNHAQDYTKIVQRTSLFKTCGNLPPPKPSTSKVTHNQPKIAKLPNGLLLSQFRVDPTKPFTLPERFRMSSKVKAPEEEKIDSKPKQSLLKSLDDDFLNK